MVASVRTPPPGGEALDLADAAATILAAPARSAGSRRPLHLGQARYDRRALAPGGAAGRARPTGGAARSAARDRPRQRASHPCRAAAARQRRRSARSSTPYANESAAAGLRDAVPALEAALDAAFAGSGLPGLAVGLWIPDGGNWVATRGVADRAHRATDDRRLAGAHRQRHQDLHDAAGVAAGRRRSHSLWKTPSTNGSPICPRPPPSPSRC